MAGGSGRPMAPTGADERLTRRRPLTVTGSDRSSPSRTAAATRVPTGCATPWTARKSSAQNQHKAVKSNRELAMPEEFLDLLEASPLHDEPRRTGVPEVMKPKSRVPP